ncbi:MAG TPA: hypothetical protein VMS75_02225 [Terriglobales bacterium]|nr:hypothetical protein [Terriglobales bacterium]
MQVQIERDIYIRAARCHELLSQSIRTFEDYLAARTPANDPEYYKARNFLKEGKGFFDQTLADAKKLLAPIPLYAPKDFEQSRSRLLVENKIIVRGQTLDGLTAELQNDDFIRTFMNAAEVADYVRLHFAGQSSGKRKLQNIKMRMTVDKLAALHAQGVELQKKAQQKQQGLPY